MNYAITGHCGLIGSKLKERLDKEGHKCNLKIDLRDGSNILNINQTDYNEKTQPIDIFFCLSAACRINKTIENPELAHFNNAEGTFQALEFCRKNNIKKFIYMSSSRTLSPEENPYTASKKYGEHLCEAYKQCYGIDYLIIRPSTVYGEGHDLTTRLITKWVINALTNKPLILYGDQYKTLDFTHVDDFVDGVILLLKNWEYSKNQSYDICGDDCRKLVDVYDLIVEEVYRQTDINSGHNQISMKMESPEIAQPQQIYINISKMRKFGYEPKVKIEEGIKRLVNFYLTEGKKWITK